MATFEFNFVVDAPRAAVAAFHYDTRVLKQLTPPPVFIQVLESAPMSEGMEARFRMWLGPLPLYWHVIHEDVGEHGFTDRALEGPMGKWQHTHRFVRLDEERTEIREHVEFEHPRGAMGLLTRLLFARPNLFMLFVYRRLRTRLGLRARP